MDAWSLFGLSEHLNPDFSRGYISDGTAGADDIGSRRHLERLCERYRRGAGERGLPA